MSKKKVKVGNLTLGGEHIYIQSMLNIPADDVEGNVRQAIDHSATSPKLFMRVALFFKGDAKVRIILKSANIYRLF